LKTLTIFCSACDRNVELAAPSGDLPRALESGEVECAEHGVRCTGTACPFCARCLAPAGREGARAGGAPTAA